MDWEVFSLGKESQHGMMGIFLWRPLHFPQKGAILIWTGNRPGTNDKLIARGAAAQLRVRRFGL